MVWREDKDSLLFFPPILLNNCFEMYLRRTDFFLNYYNLIHSSCGGYALLCDRFSHDSSQVLPWVRKVYRIGSSHILYFSDNEKERI